MKQHALARAVIVRGGCVLLIQRSESEELAPGRWQCPGGTQEIGKTIEKTLAREVHEETGLVVTACRPLGKTVTVLSRGGVEHEWTQHDFLAEARGHSVALSEEHQAFEWKPIGEAARQGDLTPEARTALRHAIAAIRSGGSLD